MLFPRPFISFPSSASLHYHFSFRTFLRVRFLSSSPVAPFENPASDPPVPRKRLCGNDFDNDLMMMIFMSSLHVLHPDFLLVFFFFLRFPLDFLVVPFFPFHSYSYSLSLLIFPPILLPYLSSCFLFFLFLPFPLHFLSVPFFPFHNFSYFLSLLIPPALHPCLSSPSLLPYLSPHPSSRFLSSPT